MAVIGDYTHQIAGLKGWPAVQPLDHESFFCDSNNTNYAVAGRAGTLSSANAWTAGVTGGANLMPPPLFLLESLGSFDVSTSTGNTYGVVLMPTGKFSALVGYGAFELYTTEFDTSLASYTPGMPLKAPTASQTSNSAAQTGLLYAYRNWTGGGGGQVTVNTDTVVGVASWGVANAGSTSFPTVQATNVFGANFTNPYGVANLAFWPVYQHGTQ